MQTHQNGLIIEKRGCLAQITLDRPAAKNALTDEMRAAIAAALPDFGRDPQIYAMAIRSTSPSVFCAGGDVRALTVMARNDNAAARASLAREFSMIWALECFTKPTVSLIDGLVLGSGVGLTLFGTHRVAGQGYRFAMPETGIGLFPDVGVSWALSRLPDHIGRYLALTGRDIDRADAYHLGLVTHCVDEHGFQQICDRLAEADPVDAIVDQLHEAPGAPPIMVVEPLIRETFAAPTVEAILAALDQQAASSVSSAGEWCRRVAAELRKRSPMSLKVTLRHLDDCRNLDLGETLIRDYRLACRFLDGHDFYEGVRAVLIDKDHSPRWQPAVLEDCSAMAVSAYALPLEGGDLVLPSRDQMQSQRMSQ